MERSADHRNRTTTTARAARTHATALAVCALAAVVLVGCTAERSRVFRPLLDGAAELVAAEDCDDVAAGARRLLDAALVDRGPVAMEDAVGMDEDAGGSAASGADVPVVAEASPPEAPVTTAMPGSASEPAGEGRREVIGTNVQERDVDEADIVKTDGDRIVTLTGGVLRVVALDGSPAIDGRLDVRDTPVSEMFLRGDEAVLVGSSGVGVAEPGFGAATDSPRVAGRAPLTTEAFAPDTTLAPPPSSRPAPPFAQATAITIVSLVDPSRPRVSDTATVEGSYVSARMVDGHVRLVVTNRPAVVDDVAWAPDIDAARDAVASIDGAELLPRISVEGEVRALGSCSDVLMVAAPAEVDPAMPLPELGTVTTLTVGDGLDELHPVTIQGDAATVYASTSALYVASIRWGAEGSVTDVHRFALPPGGPASHTGSGQVPGRLLNQFSLSEHEDALRVVTTLDWGASGQSEARVTVLDTEGDTLDELGAVAGLGVGEEVKSVRFLGDLGYVVTFRTTDPLYALDLSDPRDPRLLGELKIPGFSEYLHPLGDGLLLGVGREADPTTGVATGLKVSLFDVSDPASMVELDQVLVPGAWSPVGSDHRAFLWDARRSQAVVPVDLGGGSGPAMVLRVVDRKLERTAEVRHGDAVGVTPLRSLVVDGDLWTLSPVGLASTSADEPGTLEAVLPF